VQALQLPLAQPGVEGAQGVQVTVDHPLQQVQAGVAAGVTAAAVASTTPTG
jgi:hypothetical protein